MEESPGVRRVLAVLVPAEPPTEGSQRPGASSIRSLPPPPVRLAPAELEAVQRFLDPYHDAGLAPSMSVWVNLRLGSGREETRIEVPHRDPDDLAELLETLYVVSGWPAVDGVVERVQRSLIAAVADILGIPDDELRALHMLVDADRPLYVPPDHVHLVAHAIDGLLERAKTRPWPRVVAGLKAVVPVNGLFDKSTPHAEMQPDVAANPEIAARLLADAVAAIGKAREQLKEDVLAALVRTEREAHRLISSMLTDAHATICRETIRYFAFKDDGSVAGALTALKEHAVATDGKPKADRAVTEPQGLQATLRQLTPSANEVVKLENTSRQGITVRRMVEAELERKRVTYGHELGRHAQEYPVLSQIAVKDVEAAAGAGPALLGGYVFPPLRTAYAANRDMGARVREFPTVARRARVRADRHPERAMAREIVAIGAAETVWGYPKYLERALSRVAGPADDFTRKAVGDTLAALDVAAGSAAVAEGLEQAAGEMLTMMLASQLVPRFLPALNVMLAAWHVTVAVQEFGKRHDEFYCSLDPRDALIEAAPSTSGLVFEIATEAVFAFI
jgi:hypothetical protein